MLVDAHVMTTPMVVVAEPFDAPKVTQRMWCLFEVAMAAQYGVSISVRLPISQVSRLRHCIMGVNGHEILIKVMLKRLGMKRRSRFAWKT